MVEPDDTDIPQTAARVDRWSRWALDKTITLQILCGLFLPATFLLTFLKWQRLRFWRAHSSADNLEHVAREHDIASVFDTVGAAPLEALEVLRMDLLLAAAIALMAVLVVHLLEARRWRLGAVVALQVGVLAWCEMELIAFFFFERTGTSLDLSLAALFVTRLEEFRHLVSAEGQASVPGLLTLFLIFFLAFPWLLARVVADRPSTDPKRPPAAVFGAGSLVALVLITASFLPSWSQLPDEVLSNSMVHMVQTALRGKEGPSVGVDELDEPPLFARLRPDGDFGASGNSSASGDKGEPAARPPNVVLIILESTRPDDMSVYGPVDDGASGAEPTTPFLETIADDSLLFERHYTTVPHTSKALVSILCGIYPHWRSITTEALPTGLPARCLPDLLARHGYATGYFQAATEKFEDRHMLVDNMGFEHLFSAEDVSDPRFEVVNYFGYEEDALLEPSLEWVDEHADRPFLLTYLTVMAHSPYTPPGVAQEGRSAEEVREHYRDTIRYADRFIERIFAHFRKEGLDEDTIFVILSDHGEAFGEHGIYSHNGVLYEEGVRSAMMIHAPGDRSLRGRRDHLSSHLDVLPTVADAAGFTLEGATYPGTSVLDKPAGSQPRRIMLHGWYDNRVLGVVEGDQKFIYYFSDRPAELYDLAEDPAETRPLPIDEARREQLTEEVLWERNANYRLYDAQKSGALPPQKLAADIAPEVAAEEDLGPRISLLGVDPPRFFGPNRARMLNIYVRLAAGAHPAGTPLRLEVRAGGETVADKSFDLLDEPIEVDEPTTLARAVDVRVPGDLDVSEVDLRLFAPGMPQGEGAPAVDIPGIEVRSDLKRRADEGASK